LETRLAPLAASLRAGQLTLDTYLEQLETHFMRQEAQVQAFVPEPDRFVRLHREAAELEKRYPNPESCPLLYGVPVGIKDIFHVDGLPTQAGSRMPAEILTGHEARSVSRLKQAGALILGKTVTTEFAYFAPGPTRNPHNLAHTPGGSSSGSAAGVAAGLCPLALGTQTIGSVIRPASFCGVVGFKPSFGRISTEGVIPVSVSLDHVGCFAQDVAGAMLAASVLVNEWREVERSADRPILGVPEGLYLQKTGVEGLVHFRATQQKLTQAGYEIRPARVMADFADIASRHKTLMAAEMALVHKAWFSQYKRLYRPETVDLIEQGQQVSPEVLAQCRAGQAQLRRELTALMVEQGIDLWLAPAAVGPAPATLESTGDPVMNLPWTQAGLPAINLPTGFAQNGLPLGLQLVGRWQQDEDLLIWAERISDEPNLLQARQ